MEMKLNLINLFFIFSHMSSIWWILMTKQLITITNAKNLGQNTMLQVHSILKGLWDPLEYTIVNLLNIIIMYLEGGPNRP